MALTADGLTQFKASYLETALWSETDGEDPAYADVKLSDAARARIKKDCEEFESKAIAILNAADYCSDDFPLAHDFWLTRNHHGAGFWDDDYPEPLGQKLTDLAHSFGECDLYIGDDGKLYLQ